MVAGVWGIRRFSEPGIMDFVFYSFRKNGVPPFVCDLPQCAYYLYIGMLKKKHLHLINLQLTLNFYPNVVFVINYINKKFAIVYCNC